MSVRLSRFGSSSRRTSSLRSSRMLYQSPDCSSRSKSLHLRFVNATLVVARIVALGGAWALPNGSHVCARKMQPAGQTLAGCLTLRRDDGERRYR